jgi:hypothetical protein
MGGKNPEDANIMPSGGHDALLEAFLFLSSINPKRLYRKGGEKYGKENLLGGDMLHWLNNFCIYIAWSRFKEDHYTPQW